MLTKYTALHQAIPSTNPLDLKAVSESANPSFPEVKTSFRNGSSLIEPALQSAQDALAAFATDPTFTRKMDVAFGNEWNHNAANCLFQSWVAHDFDNLPKIEVRQGNEINGANGAFAGATNTIYLSNDFLAQNSGNLKAVTSVLLEEIGHSIDLRINKVDAAGDEGDIFSRLVRGEAISARDLLSLKAEDDHAIIKLNGKSIAIEMSQIALASFNGKLFQTHQGEDHNIYTRYSLNADATSWSQWTETGGGTPSAPAMASWNNRLYQAHRGNDNQIYNRYSTDGTTWSGWTATSSQTFSAPSLASVNNRLYESHRGTDNKIYIHYALNNDATQWSSWRVVGGATTPSAPALAAFNGRLYQVHRGNDNRIYLSYALNPDATQWSGWKASGDAVTESAPTLVSFNGSLYEAHRGLDNHIYTRSSADGDNWSGWVRAKGNTSDGFALTPDAPSITVVGDRLYQTHQGTDMKIYTSWTTDGVNWSGQTENGGTTPTEGLSPNPSGKWLSQLSNLSDDQWDAASGNDTLFDGIASNGESSPEVKQVFSELSNALFGKFYRMNAGYVYDQDYMNGFGVRHTGIDFDAPIGASVKALTKGTVTDIWTDTNRQNGMGTTIFISDGTGKQWVYGHLQNPGSWKIGDSVSSGQVIGKIGNQAQAQHLHLGVYTNGSWRQELPKIGWGRGPISATSTIKKITMSPLQAFWQLKNA